MKSKERNPYDQRMIDYLTSKTFGIKLLVTISLILCSCCLLIYAIFPILQELGIIQIR